MNPIATDALFIASIYLDFSDLLLLRNANKFFKEFVENPKLWKMKLKLEMGYNNSTLPAELTKLTYARLYARLSALKRLNPQLYNDVRNFIDISHCKFECEAKEEPNYFADTLPNLSTYPPIFASTFQKYNTGISERYFPDALDAGNIKLAFAICKSLPPERARSLCNSFELKIKNIFLLGRPSAFYLLNLPIDNYYKQSSIEECTESGNPILIQRFIRYLSLQVKLGSCTNPFYSASFVNIATKLSVESIDVLATNFNSEQMKDLNDALTFCYRVHVLRKISIKIFII